jgi:hypothetical protein
MYYKERYTDKINTSPKRILLTSERKEFLMNLLLDHSKKYNQHPNTIAYQAGVSSTRLFRVMTGTDSFDTLSAMDMIKLLDFFGYKLEVRILPK